MRPWMKGGLIERILTLLHLPETEQPPHSRRRVTGETEADRRGAGLRVKGHDAVLLGQFEAQ